MGARLRACLRRGGSGAAAVCGVGGQAAVGQDAPAAARRPVQQHEPQRCPANAGQSVFCCLIQHQRNKGGALQDGDNDGRYESWVCDVCGVELRRLLHQAWKVDNPSSTGT